MAGMTPPLPDWPSERPLAVSLSVMLEGWAEGSAPGIGPMGNPLKPGVRDLHALSWAAYGPKVGAWRLLDLLDRAERQDIIRCREVLAATAGTLPLGWLSPRCTPSGETSRLLARAGFKWHADMFDSDVPYRIETDEGALVGMPFTMEVNDMPLYVRYGNEPEAFPRTLARIIEGWDRLGSPYVGIDITVHAHVFGRPYGAIAFLNALELAARSSQCWLTNHAELAAGMG
jgi:hypothetical protein